MIKHSNLKFKFISIFLSSIIIFLFIINYQGFTNGNESEIEVKLSKQSDQLSQDQIKHKSSKIIANNNGFFLCEFSYVVQVVRENGETNFYWKIGHPMHNTKGYILETIDNQKRLDAYKSAVDYIRINEIVIMSIVGVVLVGVVMLMQKSSKNSQNTITVIMICALCMISIFLIINIILTIKKLSYYYAVLS
ncbi:hypothetical protein CLPU_15c00680 [Gottschalkia purinilytica]|uniref:Uncharacterized protein n=1 Tax=Gottschalkia purinilytica TaxID=1503 RepID=A0A0L0W7Q4_GOTPU|nr:hypothetical protein [Gottschalkia purinilytica]KNF07574.1 hypothetical protein CLPU_15c00680 [Gottschalkia purinilytica]